MDERREGVRSAALFMDLVKPDWWKHVDAVRLDLSDPCDCVAGQNGLDWNVLAGFCEVFFLSSCERGDEPVWLEEIALRMESSRTAVAVGSMRA